jgi:hypothetical protein
MVVSVPATAFAQFPTFLAKPGSPTADSLRAVLQRTLSDEDRHWSLPAGESGPAAIRVETTTIRVAPNGVAVVEGVIRRRDGEPLPRVVPGTDTEQFVPSLRLTAVLTFDEGWRVENFWLDHEGAVPGGEYCDDGGHALFDCPEVPPSAQAPSGMPSTPGSLRVLLPQRLAAIAGTDTVVFVSTLRAVAERLVHSPKGRDELADAYLARQKQTLSRAPYALVETLLQSTPNKAARLTYNADIEQFRSCFGPGRYIWGATGLLGELEPSNGAPRNCLELIVPYENAESFRNVRVFVLFLPTVDFNRGIASVTDARITTVGAWLLITDQAGRVLGWQRHHDGRAQKAYADRIAQAAKAEYAAMRTKYPPPVFEAPAGVSAVATETQVTLPSEIADDVRVAGSLPVADPAAVIAKLRIPPRGEFEPQSRFIARVRRALPDGMTSVFEVPVDQRAVSTRFDLEEQNLTVYFSGTWLARVPGRSTPTPFSVLGDARTATITLAANALQARQVQEGLRAFVIVRHCATPSGLATSDSIGASRLWFVLTPRSGTHVYGWTATGAPTPARATASDPNDPDDDESSPSIDENSCLP